MRRVSLKLIVELIVLFDCSIVKSQLQQKQQQLEDKIQRVFKGEGVLCQDTYAVVEISSQTVKASNQSLISVVSEAFAQYIENVKEGSGEEEDQAFVDAAQSGSKLILQVIAEAVANVDVEIHSPARGCWAIGYGRAEAKAVAEATVSAVANAFAAANYSGNIIFTDDLVQNVVSDLQIAVEEVAVYLADGGGDGIQSLNVSVSAQTKATAVNCALAKAFSKINNKLTQVIGLATVGCIEEQENIYQLEFDNEFELYTCGCQRNSEFGAPNFCGQYGDQESGDTICYVDQTYGPCLCALPSTKYPGALWRYCGETLESMQQLLNVEQAPFLPVAYGYCSSWDWTRDIDMEIYAPPPPIPFPTQKSFQLAIDSLFFTPQCPPLVCDEQDVQDCCAKEGSDCTTQSGRFYNFNYDCGLKVLSTELPGEGIQQCKCQ